MMPAFHRDLSEWVQDGQGDLEGDRRSRESRRRPTPSSACSPAGTSARCWSSSPDRWTRRGRGRKTPSSFPQSIGAALAAPVQRLRDRRLERRGQADDGGRFRLDRRAEARHPLPHDLRELQPADPRRGGDPAGCDPRRPEEARRAGAGRLRLPAGLPARVRRGARACRATSPGARRGTSCNKMVKDKPDNTNNRFGVRLRDQPAHDRRARSRSGAVRRRTR